jgi:hypothetical protein
LYNLAGALFLGDAGSYAIGGTIGILMIYCYHRAAGGLPVLAAVLWLLLPVVDCLRVMAMRALQQRSPLEADKNHLHHRLARYWRWPICLAIYLALVVVPGSIGALWPNMSLGDRGQPACFGVCCIRRSVVPPVSRADCLGRGQALTHAWIDLVTPGPARRGQVTLCCRCPGQHLRTQPDRDELFCHAQDTSGLVSHRRRA